MAFEIKIYDQENFNKMISIGKKCLCTIEETDCMCDEFKNQEEGICHCKVYEKIQK